MVSFGDGRHDDAGGGRRHFHAAASRRRPLLSIYLDTSLIVTAFVREPQSDAAQQAIVAAQPELVISDWTITEFAAALSVKMRTGSISPVERIALRASFAQFRSRALRVVGVEPVRFAEAATLADQIDGLRAGDALHLAIAISIGVDIWTRDKGLAKAAQNTGTTVRLI